MSDYDNGGTGFFGMLFLVLIVLKFTGYITWPWWVVSAPLWAPVVVFVAVVGYVAVFR